MILSIFWVIIAILFITQLRKLNNKISLLPKIEKNTKITYPLIGRSIFEFVPKLLTGFQDTRNYLLIFISNKQCSNCKEEFNLLIPKYKELGSPFPLINLEYDSNSNEITIEEKEIDNVKYIFQYITEKQVEDLHIKNFPSYLIVNQNGIIVDYASNRIQVFYKISLLSKVKSA